MIVVLVGPRSGQRPAPETTPIGRAVLSLAPEGIRVAFTTDGLSFVEARTGGWSTVHVDRIAAVQDRYPSQTHPEAYARAREALGDAPMGNPESLTLLFRDKIATQHWLEKIVAMPAIETDPSRFAATLRDWQSGFLKPRYGALGRGIQRVQPGDALPHHVDGAVLGVPEPSFLQRDVTPPKAGAVAVRQLIQRLPDGGWLQLPAVARVAPPGQDVANVSLGAVAKPAREVLDPACLEAMHSQTARVAKAIAAHAHGAWAIEAGVDYAIDRDGRPHLLELNSRPQGRLESLATADPDHWATAHIAACARPLRRLQAVTDSSRGLAKAFAPGKTTPRPA